MLAATDYSNLPPYIKRHLATRYAIQEGEDSWHGIGDRDEYVRFALRDRQQNGLNHLAQTITDVHYASYPSRQLMKLLATLPTDGTAPVLVSELIARLGTLTNATKLLLTDTLLDIAGQTQDKAMQRTVADRALMRLLYRLDFPQAFLPAAVCARSTRKIRREASYKFYKANGIDDSGRSALAETIHHDSIRYRQVIATDHPLVSLLGLGRVLTLAPSTYWRMIAIANALEAGDHSEVLTECEHFPLELVWAVNDRKLADLAPQIEQLLERYKDDAYLLNRILQCLAHLQDKAAIELALRYATALISGESSIVASSNP